MNATYNVKSKVVAAFQHALVPLVKVLIRHGVGFHEFAAVLKEVYAKVCIREFASARTGSELSQARVAVLTGITRKEVAALMANDGPLRKEAEGDADTIANLLQAWHTDPDFVGPYGVPRDLFMTSDPSGLQTFAELVRRYGEGSSMAEMLEQLVTIDAALVPPSGEPVRVTKRTYIPESMVPQALEIFARGLRRYSATAAHNLQNADGGERIFERWVFPDDGILDRDWERFQTLVSERLQDLVRELDTKFSWFESPRTRGEDGVSVGVGIYVYKDAPEDQRDWERVAGRPVPRH
jgi:transcriptional regulator with XRE-family HTH domain